MQQLLQCYPGTVEQKIYTLWDDIVYRYDELEVTNRLSNLKKSMFYNVSHFPNLKTKVAETASLLHVITEIADTLHSPGKDHDDIRQKGLEALCKADKIVRGGPFFR